MSKRLLILMCSIFLVVPLMFYGCGGSDGSAGPAGPGGATGPPDLRARILQPTRNRSPATSVTV